MGNGEDVEYKAEEEGIPRCLWVLTSETRRNGIQSDLWKEEERKEEREENRGREGKKGRQGTNGGKSVHLIAGQEFPYDSVSLHLEVSGIDIS